MKLFKVAEYLENKYIKKSQVLQFGQSTLRLNDVIAMVKSGLEAMNSIDKNVAEGFGYSDLKEIYKLLTSGSSLSNHQMNELYSILITLKSSVGLPYSMDQIRTLKNGIIL